MKQKLRPMFSPVVTKGISSMFCAITCFTVTAQADTILRLNNASTLDTGGAWSTGTVPTGADTAQWTNTVVAANAAIGLATNATFGDLLMQNTVAINIAAGGGTLTLSGLGGVGIDMTSAGQNLTITAPLVLGSTQGWNVATGRTLTLSGGVGGGPNGISLNGVGNVTFANAVASSYTGTTTVNGGLLTVNYATAGLTSDNLSSGSSLATGGAQVNFLAAANITNNQTLTGLTLNPGWSYFSQGRGSNGKMIVNLGTITRSGVGATAYIATTSNNSLFTTTTASTSGILGGWAVYANNGGAVNATNFARGAATAGAPLAIAPPAYTNDVWAAGNNTTVTLASNGAYGDVTTNSLRFAANASSTVNLSGTNTITSGGILVSADIATGNSNTITGGTLTGAAGADLIVHQFGLGTTSLAINSIIADNTSATALTKTGPSLLTLGAANTFTGGVYLNQGETKLTPGGSLNSNKVTFPNNSSAILSLGGVGTTVGSINTSPVLAATLPVIQNANATPAVLSVNAVTNGTFAGNLQNGIGGGSLGLSKTGGAVQTLNGTNTYTGPTTISDGTLFVKNSLTTSPLITVTSPGILNVTTNGLTVGSGSTLAGTGTVQGSVTQVAGANLTPGTLGTTGTLAIGALNLSSGANLNLDVLTGGSSDRVNVAGALTLPAGQVINVNLAGTGAGTPGATYTLFTYGSLANFTPASFTIAAGGTGGLTYTFADTGSAITLSISGTAATTSDWTLATGGSWAAPASAWSGSLIPNGPGATVNFGPSIGSAATITLDGSKTVGALSFNSPRVYTIATGTSGNLIFDNGLGVANLLDSSTPANPALPGQVIAANVTLNSTTQMTVVNGETLAITGIINGTGGLTKAGAGTLKLSAVNTYQGATALNAGTLNFASGSVGTSSFTFVGGILQYAPGNVDDLSNGRSVTFTGQAVIDTNGNDIIFAGPVGNNGIGGLTKAGPGSLSLASANTFSGTILLNQGTLKIVDDSSLGAVPAAAATNLTLAAGTTLQATGPFALNANRKVVLSGGIGTINADAHAITIPGNLSGGGLLHKTGAGSLTLTSVNNVTATGGITIDEGIVFVNDATNLPGGTLTLNGTSGVTTGNAASFFNNVVVNGTNTITKNGNSNILTLAGATGAGSLTLTSNFVTDLAGDFSTFTGSIIMAGTAGVRLNNTTGGANLTLNLANQGASVRNGTGAVTIGQLLGTGNFLTGGGGGFAGAVTYTIGGKTVGGNSVDSSFAGGITNGASPTVSITKVGNSTLTLSGLNTYTGNTVVNAGTFTLADNGALAFKIGANGTNNSVSGTGIVILDGDFNLDLATAAVADGNTWSLVTVGTLASTTFGPNFTVPGFTESGNVWTKTEGTNTWRFSEATGALTLTFGPGFYTPWTQANGLTGQPGFESGALDDPDKDGVSNLMEFVLAGNPLAYSSQTPPRLTTSPTELTFTFKRNPDSKTEVVLTFQYGSTLAGWTNVVIGAASSGPDTNGVTVTLVPGTPDSVTVTVPRTLAGNGKLFGRLLAVKAL